MWRPLVLGLLLAGCAGTPVPDSVDPSVPAQSLDPDSPYRTTLQEFWIQMKACVEDKGQTVEVDPYDQSLVFTFGDQRGSELAMAAVSECKAAIDPSRGEPAPPPTDEQLRSLYSYYIAQVDCLIAAGYPASSPPPEQIFIDSEGGWSPYTGIEDVEIPRTVMRGCEQVEGRPAFLDW